MCGDYLSAPEMCDLISTEAKHPCMYIDITIDIYAKLGFPGAEQFAQIYQYFIRYDPFQGHKEFCDAVFPDMMTSFQQWLQTNPFELHVQNTQSNLRTMATGDRTPSSIAQQPQAQYEGSQRQ